MAAELFGNQAGATVTSGGTDAPAAGTVETWTLASSNLPAVSTGKTQCHVTDTAAASEIILVTNISGTTATVTRGAESTVPVTHATGFQVVTVITAGFLNTAQGVIYPSGDLTGATDTASVQAAINTGGVVTLAAGTFTFNAAWQPVSGVRVTGQGYFSTTCNWVSSAAVNAGLQKTDRVEIDHLTLQVTGFHLFTGGWCTRWFVHDCQLIQNSSGYSIWNATLTASPQQTWLENRFERNSEYVYGAVRTVEPWFISSPGSADQVNSNSWRDNVCFNQGNDTQKYWYHLQNTGSNSAGNRFTGITFEHPWGGMIWLESQTLCVIEDCLAYDIASGNGTVTQHLIYLSQNAASGTATSRTRITGGPRNQYAATFASTAGDIGLDQYCFDTVITGIGGSGSMRLFLGGSTGVTLTGCPDGGYGVMDTVSQTTAAAAGGAGTGAPAPVCTQGTNINSGIITWGTGSNPSAAAQVTVSFGCDYSGLPAIQLTPYNAATANLGVYASGGAASGFTIAAATTPAAGVGTGYYGVRWLALT